MSTNEHTNIRTTAYVNEDGGVNCKVEKYIGSTWFTTQDAPVCDTVEKFLERYPDEPVLGLVPRREFEAPSVEPTDLAQILGQMLPEQRAELAARFGFVPVSGPVLDARPVSSDPPAPEPEPGAENRALGDDFPGIAYLRKATPPITTYGAVAMMDKDQIVAVRGIGTVTADEIFADPLVASLRAARLV